jgi:hypothetical protein
VVQAVVSIWNTRVWIFRSVDGRGISVGISRDLFVENEDGYTANDKEFEEDDIK